MLFACFVRPNLVVLLWFVYVALYSVSRVRIAVPGTSAVRLRVPQKRSTQSAALHNSVRSVRSCVSMPTLFLKSVQRRCVQKTIRAQFTFFGHKTSLFVGPFTEFLF